MSELSKELLDNVLEAIEVAKKTGKVKKGTNEVTKAVERGTAKLVAVAADVNPKEITMHIAPLCAEKSIPYVEVPSREELGAAVGLQVSTVSVAITQEGDAKNLVKNIVENLKK